MSIYIVWVYSVRYTTLLWTTNKFNCSEKVTKVVESFKNIITKWKVEECRVHLSVKLYNNSMESSLCLLWKSFIIKIIILDKNKCYSTADDCWEINFVLSTSISKKLERTWNSCCWGQQWPASCGCGGDKSI